MSSAAKNNNHHSPFLFVPYVKKYENGGENNPNSCCIFSYTALHAYFLHSYPHVSSTGNFHQMLNVHNPSHFYSNSLLMWLSTRAECACLSPVSVRCPCRRSGCVHAAGQSGVLLRPRRTPGPSNTQPDGRLTGRTASHTRPLAAALGADAAGR